MNWKKEFHLSSRKHIDIITYFIVNYNTTNELTTKAAVLLLD